MPVPGTIMPQTWDTLPVGGKVSKLYYLNFSAEYLAKTAIAEALKRDKINKFDQVNGIYKILIMTI